MQDNSGETAYHYAVKHHPKCIPVSSSCFNYTNNFSHHISWSFECIRYKSWITLKYICISQESTSFNGFWPILVHTLGESGTLLIFKVKGQIFRQGVTPRFALPLLYLFFWYVKSVTLMTIKWWLAYFYMLLIVPLLKWTFTPITIKMTKQCPVILLSYIFWLIW